ncbi:MAG: tetratricopeptide repeat protein [Bacilli bacterium]
MLFSQPFERLFHAVRRIAEQLQRADPDQRRYLAEELQALRALSSDVFELWLRFEDEVDALLEQYQPTELCGPAEADAKALDAAGNAFLGGPAKAQIDNASHPQAPTAPAASLAPPGSIPAASFAADLGSAWETPAGLRFLRRGIGYFDLLMFPESIREFEQMVALDPRMVAARLYLALSYIATGAFGKAESHLAIASDTARDAILQAAVHDARAQLYMKQDRPRDALYELELVLAIQPQYSDAQVNLAICAYSVGEYGRARRAAAAALQLAQDDALAWRLYAASAWEQGDLEEAHRGYRRARRLVPANTAVTLEMAAVLTRLGRVRDAESLLRDLLDKGREPQSALRGLAEIALQTQEYERAVELLKKSASLRRDGDKSTDRLGWALYGANRLDEAKRAFERHLSANGACVSNLTGLARIAVTEGNLSEARELLLRFAHHANPAWRAHGLAELGRLYLEMGETTRAIRYLQSALVVDRRQEDALLYLELATRAADSKAQLPARVQRPGLFHEEGEAAVPGPHTQAGIDTDARLSDTESIDRPPV